MISLRSKVAQSVLRFFIANETAEGYVNELARTLQLDPGNLDRKLKELEKEGLLISEFHGQQRYYSLNREYPLLQAYRQLVNGSFGFEDLLRKKLSHIQGLQNVYLFGSYVSGTMDAHSDIDVLIVGDMSIKDTQNQIRTVSQQIGRTINPVYISESELQKRQKEKDSFVKDVFDSKYKKVI
jgi:predicted nucleotidyltransferase